MGWGEAADFNQRKQLNQSISSCYLLEVPPVRTVLRLHVVVLAVMAVIR